MARDYYESGQYQRAGDYFLALAGSGCAGDEGYFLYWSGRSYEAGGEPHKSYRPYRRILESYPGQEDPSTGSTYGSQALARALVLGAVGAEPAEVRGFLALRERLGSDTLAFYDDEGNVLASAPAKALGDYCLARALAAEGSLRAARELLREGTPPAEGTFVEGEEVRSLPASWNALSRTVPSDD